MCPKKLGFKWQKNATNCMVLMEQGHLQTWRRGFIRQIREARTSQKDVIYLDETWYNTGESVPKIWTDGSVGAQPTRAPIGKGERLIILHAGSCNGWVPNALFLKRTRCCGSLDYHKDMDAATFEEWFETQLLPNLKPGSIIVMDNASYHSRKLSKRPTQSSSKTAICDWLDSHNVPHAACKDILKKDLYALVVQQSFKDTYVIDEMAKTHGHEVLRLPPYHCHLNPIELAWGVLKQRV